MYPYWEMREPGEKHTFPHLSPKHLKTHRGQADGQQDTPGKGWAGMGLGCGAPVGGQKGMESWSRTFRGIPEGAWGLSDDGAQSQPAGFSFPCLTREAHMCWGCTPFLLPPTPSADFPCWILWVLVAFMAQPRLTQPTNEAGYTARVFTTITSLP